MVAESLKNHDDLNHTTKMHPVVLIMKFVWFLETIETYFFESLPRAEIPLLKWDADIRLNKLTLSFCYCKVWLGSNIKVQQGRIVGLVQSAAAVAFQNYIMCTVMWLVVYTEVFMILLNH